VLQRDLWVFPFGTFLRCLAFFAAAAFPSVDVSAVPAAEIAHASLRRTDLQDEVMARDAQIIRQSDMAVGVSSQ
jgi:hypothetical protein